jgi:hypothetical protein
MASIVRLCAAAALAALSAAHPGYVLLNPNGGNVTIPHGIKAIGHTNGEGGGPTTPYGDDFVGQGNNWTQALCLHDSDGDGQTNGLELGDPCCVWSVGSKPSVSHAISHPGLADYTTTRKCKSYKCSNGVDPCTPQPLPRRRALRG